MNKSIVYISVILLLFFSSCAPIGKIYYGTYNKIFKKELEIKKDKIPKSYNPVLFPTTINASNLNLDQTEIDVFNISTDNNLYYYQFSLLENQHTYFNDLNKNHIKSIKVIRGEKTCIVENYRVHQDPRPMAMSIVLDHSGSMGDIRADMLQTSLSKEILNTRSKDEFTIIKFSFNNDLLVSSKSSTHLSNSLSPPIGLSGYGASTSLLDAVGSGMDELSKSQLERKMILLFTDGIENTSKKYNLSRVIERAKNENVSIITCGFGYFVNNPMLHDLSSQTGGYHFNLYDRNEYDAFFNTIFHRLNNNVELSFSPCMFGDDMQVEIGMEINNTRENYYIDLNHPLEAESIIELNVFFDTNKHLIHKKYFNELDRIAIMLNQYPTIVVEIGGHTDSDGDALINQKLSEKRAKSINDYLVNKGVGAHQLILKGYGESQPKYLNTSDWNKSLNRRSEIKIISI